MAEASRAAGRAGRQDPVGDLLLRLCGGEQQAFGELLRVVYDELRQSARARLRQDNARHSLDPSELVHEAYLRLVDQRHKCWENRAHFLAVSATAMRRVLFDHVRRHRRRKRGSGAVLAVDPDLVAAGVTTHEFLDLHDTLSRLEEQHPRAARVVELKVFGGMTHDEIAAVLGVSVATVKRDWTQARAWLRRDLQ